MGMTQRDVMGREVGGGSCLGTHVIIKDFILFYFFVVIVIWNFGVVIMLCFDFGAKAFKIAP